MAEDRKQAYNNIALMCSQKLVEAMRSDMFPDETTEKFFGIVMHDTANDRLGDLIYNVWTAIYKRRLFHAGETVYDEMGPASQQFVLELANAITTNRLAPSFRDWVQEVVDDTNCPIGGYCAQLQSRRLNLDFVIHPTDTEHREWMERFQTELGGTTASAQQESSSHAEKVGELGVGRWVTIAGLQSAKGRDLNDRVGQVQTEELDQDGRYQIKVDGIRGIKLIKPINLVDIPPESLVKILRLSCDGELRSQGRCQVIQIPRQYSLLQNAPAEGNAPAMALTGVPLMVRQATPRVQLRDRGDYDNQHATWMMIDPISGFAPPMWQSYVGPVLVYRPGGQDFETDDYDSILEFLSQLLDEFGEGPHFEPTTWLNPAFFQNFLRDLIQQRAANKGSGLSSLENLNIVRVGEMHH